jgi:hypothetical protein
MINKHARPIFTSLTIQIEKILTTAGDNEHHYLYVGYTKLSQLLELLSALEKSEHRKLIFLIVNVTQQHARLMYEA